MDFLQWGYKLVLQDKQAELSTALLVAAQATAREADAHLGVVLEENAKLREQLAEARRQLAAARGAPGGDGAKDATAAAEATGRES